jgi:hypothetical protein
VNKSNTSAEECGQGSKPERPGWIAYGGYFAFPGDQLLQQIESPPRSLPDDVFRLESLRSDVDYLIGKLRVLRENLRRFVADSFPPGGTPFIDPEPPLALMRVTDGFEERWNRIRLYWRLEERQKIFDAAPVRTVPGRHLTNLEWDKILTAIVVVFDGIVKRIDKALGTAEERAIEAHPFVKNEHFVFRPSGDGYSISGFGERGHVSATGCKDLHFYHKLLQAACKPVRSFKLVGAHTHLNSRPSKRRGRLGNAIEERDCDIVDEPVGTGARMSEPVHTCRDMHPMRQRLHQIPDEIKTAENQELTSKVAELRKEQAGLERHLRVTVDLRGRVRREKTDAEKLQPKIFMALMRARKRLVKFGMPTLAQHLKDSVTSQGEFFIYHPAPPISWVTDAIINAKR